MNALVLAMDIRLHNLKHQIEVCTKIAQQRVSTAATCTDSKATASFTAATSATAKLAALRRELSKFERDRLLGVAIRDVVPGAVGAPAILDRRVALSTTNIRARAECERLLATTTEAPPASTNVECDDGKRYSLLTGESVFLCAKNTALFDGRFVCQPVNTASKPVLFMYQDKHSEETTQRGTVTTSIIQSWYAKAVSAMVNFSKTFDVVYLYVTNRRLTAEPAALIDSCAQLLLVTREQLSLYLSPTLAHRGLLAVDDE